MMNRFVHLRAELTPVDRVEVCFVAMAEPSFATTLPRVAELGYRRVVVQPHLLFAGDLLAEVGTAVAQIARGRTDQQWLVTAELGPDPLLAQAVVELSRRK